MRNFQLYYYPQEKSVEMFDLKTKKTFLKKTENGNLKQADLYLGNSIVLYSRTLTIFDYGDDFTRNICASWSESTFLLLKPEGVRQTGLVLTQIQDAGFTLARAKLVQMTRHQAEYVYIKFNLDPEFNDLVSDLSNGENSLAMELVSQNGHGKLLALRQDSSIGDIIHGSQNLEEAESLINFFFPKSRLLSSSLQTPSNLYMETPNTTCCIIRPHVYLRAGNIIQDIEKAGFKIFALETFLLDFGKADEFLEVYKGVLANYGEVVRELSSGPCLALQIAGQLDNTEDVVKTFRQLCGPRDPQVARSIRPGTLRAVYGETEVRNSVHCTDLSEDGPLEVEYFFKVLQ